MTDSDAFMKLRMSRLLMMNGYFVRRKVPISSYTKGWTKSKRVDITDIDVYGIKWDEHLQPIRVICECKSGSDKKPLDRSFWLSGVMSYFEAKKGYLLVVETGSIPQTIGQKLGIAVLDDNLLSTLEQRSLIDTNIWVASYSQDTDKNIEAYRKELSSIMKLQLNYLIYGYWKDSDFAQIKKLIKLGNDISSQLNIYEAFQWFIIECICLFSCSLLNFCSRVFFTTPKYLDDEISTNLFGGYLLKNERENILRDMMTSLQKNNKNKLRLDPEYLGELAELVNRLIQRPREAKMVPLLIDYISYEFLLKNKPFSKEEIENIFGSLDIYILTKLAKNIVQFYLKTTLIKTTIYEGLLAF